MHRPESARSIQREFLNHPNCPALRWMEPKLNRNKRPDIEMGLTQNSGYIMLKIQTFKGRQEFTIRNLIGNQ